MLLHHKDVIGQVLQLFVSRLIAGQQHDLGVAQFIDPGLDVAQLSTTERCHILVDEHEIGRDVHGHCRRLDAVIGAHHTKATGQ